MALHTLMTQTVRNQRRIRWLKTITMFDFDIQHIQDSKNILADALSRIYDGVREEELTREDYLQEEQKYLNTDVFLPKNSSTPMPYFSYNFNYNPYITTPFTPIGYLNPPQFVIQQTRYRNSTLQDDQVIPELHRENVTFQPDHLPMSNNVSTQTSQPPISAHAKLCGLTRLPIGDGCTAAPIFWEDCNATGQCKAHLANHIDSYSHRLDGLPKRTFSTHHNSPSSTTTERATPERIT